MGKQEKKLSILVPKKGVEILLRDGCFQLLNQRVELVNVWDVIEVQTDRRLAENIKGSKEAVTRLAQEAFGWEHVANFKPWELVPSQTKIASCIDSEAILKSLGFSTEPIYEQ